ncbi:hypothetical protein XBP1_530005 [Xenorhabdus bovienii str. puntauvense]|uniref:Uncharacterized protein n=2 Tax=Xenorhabdus bovienii TaxID=40576 RepID=A0A077N9H5_XENBV|nr:hypothetical protein XBP1_530005 [Xenorhabdus bovienii str. puntauvense]CDH26743.1 hypothetical protein XBKB1_910008 [Xenorhabdus bovienii str. kraussei Becker Underwood]
MISNRPEYVLGQLTIIYLRIDDIYRLFIKQTLTKFNFRTFYE